MFGPFRSPRSPRQSPGALLVAFAAISSGVWGLGHVGPILIVAIPALAVGIPCLGLGAYHPRLRPSGRGHHVDHPLHQTRRVVAPPAASVSNRPHRRQYGLPIRRQSGCRRWRIRLQPRQREGASTTRPTSGTNSVRYDPRAAGHSAYYTFATIKKGPVFPFSRVQRESRFPAFCPQATRSHPRASLIYANLRRCAWRHP